MIQLASKSPRRKELLEQIGVPFVVVEANVPEVMENGEQPISYVERLAHAKASAGVGLRPGRLTLGADTIVVCGEQVLEKPVDYVDFNRMLKTLSGCTHQVITAVALVDGMRSRLAHEVTEVEFGEISDQQIRAYWASGEPHDKAGGYGIQGLGAVFVERISGSFSNVVGLPLTLVSRMLGEFGCPIWNGEYLAAPLSLTNQRSE